MEAILNNEQVRPGDETQFMHAVFTSEEEMIEGFGLYMTQTSISNSERKCTAKNIGYQMKFLLDIIKESGSFLITGITQLLNFLLG